MGKRLICKGLAGVAVGFAALGLGLPAAWSQQATDYVGATTTTAPPSVLGAVLERPPAARAEVAAAAPAARAQAARGQQLPVTGGDLAGLAAAGLGAVGTGTILIRRSRRHRSS